MSTHELDRTLLGAYTLGALEPDEARTVEAHLATCAECRTEVEELAEMKEFLGEVPPEAFLDGPPEDGDLLLQRTLRQVRTESRETPAPTRSWLVAAAAVVVIAGAALGGGVLIGRQTGGSVAGPYVSTPVAGVKQATGTAGSTTMAVTVTPRTGWVWVEVRISGLKAGAECELRVTDAAGTSYVAGSWLVSEKAAREGSTFSGGVLVPIDRVTSVDLLTLDGDPVVSARI